MTRTKNFHFTATKSSGEVSAMLMTPDNSEKLLVFAHGAGAGMTNSFMQKMSEQLAGHGIATFRYNFPYMEKKKKSPDPKGIVLSTIRSAVDEARKQLPGIPLFAGGKSFGGRMTSTAESENDLDVKGIVFFGFPLHPPGKPSDERAVHLNKVKVPMLFLQGTRDSLADLKLLLPVCKRLGKFAELYSIEGGDHSFRVRGKKEDDVIAELARKVKDWSNGVVQS
jgi:uncharacterized protein